MALRNQLRADPAFRDLLNSLPAPQLPRYRVSGKGSPEEQNAQWHYWSGRCDEREDLEKLFFPD